MRNHRERPRLLALAILIGLVLMTGCRGTAGDDALPDDGPPIVTSPEAARAFVDKLAVASDQIEAGNEVSLTVTQEELTSFLDLGSQLGGALQDQDVETLSDLENVEPSELPEGTQDLPEWVRELRQRGDLPDVRLPDLSFWLSITDPQVYLKGNGQVVFRGNIELAGQRQPVRLVMVPRASGGEVVLDFVEGQLGPLPVPEWLIDRIGQGLVDLILAGREYVQVNTIQVGEGQMTLVGQYRR